MGVNRQLQGSGGHRPLVELDISEAELKQIVKDLERLFPTDDVSVRRTVRGAMRSALKPTLKKLQEIVPSRKHWKATLRGENKGKPGQLNRSLALINGKNINKRMPAVYVGPRVKGAYSKADTSGFYMYFLEYGYFNKILQKSFAPRRYFDKAKAATEHQVYGYIIPKLKASIARRFKKKGLR